jgi:hypothetical protein
VRVEVILVRIEITLFVWKLHSACLNHTLSYGKYTLRVGDTLLRVEITFFVHESHKCMLKSHSGVCFEK